MFGYDLVCAYLRRLFKGQFFVRPRCGDHARHIAVKMSARSLHKISHAVYQPHITAHIIAYTKPYTLARHKFRLGGHYSPALGTLRQFVLCALSVVAVRYLRQYRHIHKSAYKSRFARADRSYHAYVNIALGACRYVFVYTAVHFSSPPFGVIFLIEYYIHTNTKP